MVYYVIKRDGRKAEFDPSKIEDAVLKAFKAVDGEITPYAQEKAKNISDYIKGYMEGIPNELTIDDIQTLVQNGLMSTKRKDVATAYIEYRHDRDKERQWNNKMMNTLREKLSASNVINQNANVDEHSFGGRKGEADEVIMKQYALDNCMSEKARRRHLNNEIYTHDLGSYVVGMHNCLSIPFDDLLAKGFNTRQTDVRPANSINTAFQLVAVISQLQSLQQFGGVAATHLDWTMVPYVRKSFIKHWKDGMTFIEAERGDEEHFNKMIDLISNDDKWYLAEHPSIEDEIYGDHGEWSAAYDYAYRMTIKELQQAVEGMFHNLNTLQSRSGNQLPFTSINFGTCTLPEGRMVIKALLDGSIKGVGKFHKTPIFPCSIFQCMKGVNRKPGDPNYDLFRLALESTAKRLYPNYANCDVQMQKDWISYDRKQKEEYINSLSESQYSILIQRLEENPELQNILMLEIYEEEDA